VTVGLASLRGTRALRDACRVHLRCLLVDDSGEFLASATRLLIAQGAEVAGVASTRADALKLARELNPDVVLVDVLLGDEDGVAVAAALHAAFPEIPVILISTHAEEDVVDAITGSGAVGFLSKASLGAKAIERLLR
jgi:DNA-binding NarL/FixJ family response regulator